MECFVGVSQRPISNCVTPVCVLQVRFLKHRSSLSPVEAHMGHGKALPLGRGPADFADRKAKRRANRGPFDDDGGDDNDACGSLADGDKVDCGFGTITQEQCEASGCCWAEAADDVPWCFDGAKPPNYSYQNSASPSVRAPPCLPFSRQMVFWPWFLFFFLL